MSGLQANWRRFLTGRSIFALCVGAVLLALVIWFDAIWLWGVAAIFVAGALVAFEWVLSSGQRKSRRAEQIPRDAPAYKRRFWN